MLAAIAVAAPPLAAAAVTSRTAIPIFAQVLNRANRVQDFLAVALGLALIVLTALALQIALGLVFDPRYRDFPFAPFTAAVVPFLVVSTLNSSRGARGIAEIAAAVLLAACLIYLVPNEGWANWQSLWLAASFAILAFILARARGERG